jgi:hypothetical protein
MRLDTYKLLCIVLNMILPGPLDVFNHVSIMFPLREVYLDF